MASITIDKGFVIVDTDTVRAVVAQLKTDITTDKALAARLKRDPRRVLGDRGLSKPIQDQMLKEERASDPNAPEGHCVCTLCCWTLAL